MDSPPHAESFAPADIRQVDGWISRRTAESFAPADIRQVDGWRSRRTAESFAPADIRQVDGWRSRRTRSPSRLPISARSTDGDPAARGVLRACRYPLDWIFAPPQGA